MFIENPPGTDLSPLPLLLVSCTGTSEAYKKENIISIAWAGIINSEPPMLSISIRKPRFSHTQIMESMEFVAHPVTEALVEACNYCGTKSGYQVDKFTDCGLKATPVSALSHAKAIAGAPLALACKVTQVIELPTHDVFFAEIVQTLVEESFGDANGTLDLDRAKLMAFTSKGYRRID